MGENNLTLRPEELWPAVAPGSARIGRKIIAAKRNILGGRHNRFAAGWAEYVIRRHHEQPGFQLCFHRERHVDSHLIAVEVRVISGANQGMDPDSFAFNEHRFKGLDREPMQGRRAVEQDWVAFGNLFQDVPDFRRLPLDHLFRRTHGVDIAQLLEAPNNEWLEKHQRHFLRQPALVQLELRPNYDHRTSGVIDALAEQVLTEPSALALKHVAERL